MRLPVRLNTIASLKALPWVVASTGLLTTTLWCSSGLHANKLEHERLEIELAREIALAISTRLQTNIAILDSVVGLFNASSEVSREEFTSFYQTLNRGSSTLRGIQGLGYAAVVPGNNVTAFEKTIRSDSLPDFKIKPPGIRALTTAIVYLEPNDWRNQRALGYDMYSQATRREAMQSAASNGEPALSGPVRLLQETSHRPQVGALVYQAIYRRPDEAFTSVQDRFRRLRGWAYSPLRMDDLIQGALSSVSNPALQGAAILIYDTNRNDPGNLLFDSQDLEKSKLLSHPTWKEVSIANRTWQIGIQLSNTELSPNGWSKELALQGFLGLSLSALAAVICQRILNNHLILSQSLARELEASRERALASTVFDSSPMGIVVTDPDGVILQINSAFSQLSGYSELEARGQKTNLLRSGRHENSFYEQMWSAIIQKGYWNGEIWNRHRNGQIMRHELSITAVLDQRDQITSFVGLLRDVSERYSQQQQMRYLATHDPLTSLANRSLLIEQLDLSLALAKRQNHGVGLFFLDLDQFKPVNDRYGHGTGDVLLKAIGERLKRFVRESDTVCRQGGDEFVVLIPDAPALEQLLLMAKKLNQMIQDPFVDLPELPAGISVTASIGVARWPDHASDADGLMEAADTAMYQAKQMIESRIASAPLHTESSDQSS
ncbi:MAG: CHASE domain-containing protein [Vulcanococcus sp.]|jgi:diguanylate cyclase (GGDEF)-like protein/PAS domain S-box-containing protein